MYSPQPFTVNNPKEIIEFIKGHPLGSIVSTNSVTGEIMASHIPWIVSKGKESFSLLAHLSKANPQSRNFTMPTKVLIIFKGADAYISSYAKDPEQLSILPTWNYQFVQIHGEAQLLSEQELLGVLEVQMHYHEQKYPKQLTLNNYDANSLKKKLRQITAIKVTVSKIEGCFRLNQNRTEQEKRHIAKTLKEIDGNDEMAELIKS